MKYILKYLKEPFLVIVILAFLLISCSSDNDNNTSTTNNPTNDSLAIDIVTGLSLRSDINNASIILGNPNIKENPIDNNIRFSPTPNPPTNIIQLTFTNIGFESSPSITNVWIIKANPSKDYSETDYNEILKDFSYEESKLDSLSILNSEDLEDINNEILINLDQYDPGYYRIFIKTERGMEWSNIIILDPDNSDAFDELEEFWNT